MRPEKQIMKLVDKANLAGSFWLLKLAQANIVGQIKIGDQAVKSDSFLRINVVTLGSTAKAQVSPQLEILTNDVQASHAATVGRFGDEEMFYLTSRGLAEPQAKELLIAGFFRPILQRIKNSRVRLAIMGGIGVD